MLRKQDACLIFAVTHSGLVVSDTSMHSFLERESKVYLTHYKRSVSLTFTLTQTSLICPLRPVFPCPLCAGFPVLFPVVTGGPLPSDHEYELHEVRFHWGKENQRGSEHTVNFKAFPMEVESASAYTYTYKHTNKAMTMEWSALSKPDQQPLKD